MRDRARAIRADVISHLDRHLVAFSERLTMDEYGTMFHGDDERVDVESLRLSTLLWEAVAEDLLS